MGRIHPNRSHLAVDKKEWDTNAFQWQKSARWEWGDNVCLAISLHSLHRKTVVISIRISSEFQCLELSPTFQNVMRLKSSERSRFTRFATPLNCEKRAAFFVLEKRAFKPRLCFLCLSDSSSQEYSLGVVLCATPFPRKSAHIRKTWTPLDQTLTAVNCKSNYSSTVKFHR